jgi:hypothetical protein
MARPRLHVALTLASLGAGLLAAACAGGTELASPPADTIDLPPGTASAGDYTSPALARRPFPADNPWNTDVSAMPVDPNSAALVAACGTRGLHADFGTVWDGAPNGIPYVLVGAGQRRVPVSFQYADESDPGPYPIPASAPIEGGPASDGDRHVIVVDTAAWKLYELWDAHPRDGGASWTAGSGAVFDLSSNALRPAGWTSADAAGLPIFPGLVRYDEAVGRRSIDHALRFTCPATRRGYVDPARHFASSNASASLPPMGMRVRLRASFDTTAFSPETRVILRAMMRYGMLLADNGSAWYVSGAPDARWSDEHLAELSRVPSGAFEVVRLGTVH